MNKILLLFLFVIYFQYSFGQGFERQTKTKLLKLSDGTEERVPETDLLQQLGLSFNNAVPRVTIKALKMAARMSKNQYLDFYVFSSLPSLGTKPADSAINLGNELQNIYGGLLNTYFNKHWDFDNESDKHDRGVQFDVKAGYKIVESTKDVGKSNVYLHTGQLGTELKWIIPLFKNPTDADEDMAGLVQLKASGQGLLVFNSGNFKQFYTNKISLVKPDNHMYSATFEGSIHILEEFYLSGGYSLSSVSEMRNMGFFKISFSKK